MADYRRGCGCWTTHEYPCRQAHDYAQREAAKQVRKNMEHEVAQARAKGFVYIGFADPADLGRRQMLWGCRRGCGTVVWNLEDHIKNVCRKFEPVVGQADAESL